jgi:S-adenosylmethionine hydrolase
MLTLTTDFGDSAYVGAVRGAVLDINSEARVVDITHAVPPHDVQSGAFALFSAVPYYPEGTTHVVVVDPGVGTDRRGIALEAGRQTFVGPDNGVLRPVARKLGGIDRVVELTEDKYVNEDISRTFHGRDVFGPVGSHLDLGVELEDLGRELRADELADLSFGEPWIEGGTWTTEAIHVDRFGNVTTNIQGGTVLDESEWGATAVVETGNLRLDADLHRTYRHARPDEPTMVIGSAGFAELAMREDSFADRYGVEVGDEIKIQFLPRKDPTEPPADEE